MRSKLALTGRHLPTGKLAAQAASAAVPGPLTKGASVTGAGG